MKKYRHNKTGKEYEVITRNFMFKDCTLFTDEGEPIYEWRKGLVLYKTLYYNPDGEYFARLPEDFDANFTEIDDEEFVRSFYEYDSRMYLTKEEWDVVSHHIVDTFNKKLSQDPGQSKHGYLTIWKMQAMLLPEIERIKKTWITEYKS